MNNFTRITLDRFVLNTIFSFFLLLSFTSFGQTVDGTITVNEYGTHTDGFNKQGNTYLTWDDNNLYVAVANSNTSEAFVLYLDKDPQIPVNGGTNANGTKVGFSYDGTSFAELQYRADLVMFVKNNYREYRTANGSNGWSNATSGFGSYAESGNTREFSIPWTAIGGKPVAFNFFSYVTSPGGFVFGQTPTENAGGNIGTGARYSRYYTVSTTTSGSSTLPFSRNSYVFNSASDVTGFGPITAYDFTMNTSGRFLSRTGNIAGDWVINGNLVVGNGIIYLGSGGEIYGPTTVEGNLNILGGEFNMDQTTALISVNGNVSIATGASLVSGSNSVSALFLKGNWSNSGTFTPNGKSITFNGTLAQTITGATTFDFLTLVNNNGLTLNNPVVVNLTLGLTLGKITLGTNNLTIGSAGSIAPSVGASNYVVTNSTGQLKRTVGNTPTLFAVGNAAYNPITFNNSGTSDVYGIRVLDGAITTGNSNTKSVNRSWVITEAVPNGSDLAVIAQYNLGEENSGFNAGVIPKIAFYNGVAWTDTDAITAGINPVTYTSSVNAPLGDVTTGTQYFAIGRDNAFVAVTPVSIFSNNIDGANPGLISPYTFGQTVNPNVTVSGIVRGVGILGANSTDSYNTERWSNSSSVVSDEYIEFTITPNAGYFIDFETFVFSHQRNATGPTTLVVRSKLDNFTSDIGGMITNSETETTSTTLLSGLSFIGGTSFDVVPFPVTFRVYGYNATGGTASLNGFIFTGNVFQLPTVYTQPLASITNIMAVNPSACAKVLITFNAQSDNGTPRHFTNSTIFQPYLSAVGGGSPYTALPTFTVPSLPASGDNNASYAGLPAIVSMPADTPAGNYTISLGCTNYPDIDGSTGAIVSNIFAVVAASIKTYNGGWTSGEPTLSDTAIISSDYDVNADINACTLTVNNNAVVEIPTGKNVTLAGSLTVSSGSFTLENNTNLIQLTNASNSGNIKVKRNSSLLKRLDYTMWSSPVTGQNLFNFSPLTSVSPSIRFYTYNSTIIAPATTGFFDSVDDYDTTTFSTGKGYLIRMPNNHPTTATIWPGEFTGLPNNGSIFYTMSTTGDGYNSIGNPYPSRLNVRDFINGNPNITGPLYFWRKTNNPAVDTYATVTKIAYTANGAAGGDTAGSFAVGDPSNWVLNVGQGFIVKATAPELVFTNSMRRSSNADQFFRNSPTINTTTNGLYWLNLNMTNEGYSQMAVGYIPDGTLAEDRGIDGKNINTQFYLTSLIGTEEYTIQGRPEFQATDVVPLSYKVTAAGNYSIVIDHTSGMFLNGQLIYLRDNLTNVVHNLTAGAYTFASNAGTFNNRFEVVYQSALDTDNPTFTANQVVIYKNEVNDFVINSGIAIMASVKVFDIRGRLLLERKNINASQTTITAGNSNEVLLVQITSEDGLVVTKKVVR